MDPLDEQPALVQELNADCRRVWFAGGGDLAYVLYWYLQDCLASLGLHIPVAGFLDNLLVDDAQAERLRCLGDAAKLPVIPFDACQPQEGDVFINALARPCNKRSLLPPLLARKARFTVLRHPTSIVQPGVETGVGCVLLPYSIIHCGTRLGDFSTLLAQASCGHGVRVGRYSTIFVRGTLLGNVSLGEEVSIYTSATVFPGVRLGDGVTVGANSVVTDHMAAGMTAMTAPARLFGLPAGTAHRTRAAGSPDES